MREKKNSTFIKKNIDTISIILVILILAIIGFADDALYAMLKLILGMIIFGIFIGFISALIKIFSK